MVYFLTELTTLNNTGVQQMVSNTHYKRLSTIIYFQSLQKKFEINITIIYGQCFLQFPYTHYVVKFMSRYSYHVWFSVLVCLYVVPTFNGYLICLTSLFLCVSINLLFLLLFYYYFILFYDMILLFYFYYYFIIIIIIYYFFINFL